MNELFLLSFFNINNINIPEEFGLSRELFSLIILNLLKNMNKISLNSQIDNNNNSHESINKSIDIYKNQNQPPDLSIVQLLLDNVKLSLDTTLQKL
ncbi:hypothetical protein RhiirA4_460737 [Rhizophagus irregularis]|uniref:Uncharacterized protein n=1 Tax=Rhizophagus irregularis TaxID=588596 RepID=A0A2I1GH86_9GLOM|nr:hypothetical protein RhiirA4_460737 [Rhizophagus irregularis]